MQACWEKIVLYLLCDSQFLMLLNFHVGCILGFQGPPGRKGNRGSTGPKGDTGPPGSTGSTSMPTNSTLCPGCPEP